jgi:carbamoyl-phosphate synthase large subunit
MVLSPEMRSTGEVMGIDTDLGHAFTKAFEAAGLRLPKRGKVFISVRTPTSARSCPRPASCRAWATSSWPPRAPGAC